MHSDKARVFRLLILTAMICCMICSAAADTWYVENEWNYLDTAMDISGGIPEDADGVLARIKRKGVLKVAMAFDCPTMNFLDPTAEGDDRYAGVDMELARLIAEKMGVDLVIVPMEPVYKLPALIGDLCDLTISAVPYTPGRALNYTLSNAYYNPGEERDIGILVRKGESIYTLDDLQNKIIVAQRDSLQEAFAAKKIDHYTEFRRVASARAVFDMVENGTAYAGIVSISMAETYFRRNPDCGMCLATSFGKIIRYSPEPQYLGYRVAAKKGETRLIAFVNGVINEALEGNQIETWLHEAEERAAGSSGKGE